ncbi:cupin domain-containing protein [Amaricoccus solimangrovi]|uniref:Cupin domain-containing protein n=1 Tax=Amaricoccus solimangrovi TaxID=2589815 RepID=A0A501WVW4_9RHOB|nr:cupin domain-containing protein [Amaricoccus solimangrovi]TPE53893.1 cupin domain-containing protein [Amaricoccus solimangrovi]
MNLPLSPAALEPARPAAAPAGAGEAALFFGNGRVEIQASRLAGDDICVMEHWLPYGEGPPLHIHRDEEEFFYLVEGRMWFRVGGEDRVIEAGQCLLGPKGVAHTYAVLSPGGAHCLTITSGTDFEGLVRELSRPASGPGLPPHVAPTPEQVFALGRACARHGIEVVGAPIR